MAAVRRWEVMKDLRRIVLTHEGHTVMCASATDARLLVESANALIDLVEGKEGKNEDRQEGAVSPI